MRRWRSRERYLGTAIGRRPAIESPGMKTHRNCHLILANWTPGAFLCLDGFAFVPVNAPHCAHFSQKQCRATAEDGGARMRGTKTTKLNTKIKN